MGMNTYLFNVACLVLLAFVAVREIPDQPFRAARERIAILDARAAAMHAIISAECRVRNAGHPAIDALCN
jgi:hypothetical protein